LYKNCKCGASMDIRLRTVIYSSKVEIENVPIYSCDSCYHTELMIGIKHELVKLIGSLGSKPEKQKLQFDEWNEWAHLITLVSDKERMHLSIQTIINHRIDELLDVMLLARSLGDKNWEQQLRERLSQITKPVLTT